MTFQDKEICLEWVLEEWDQEEWVLVDQEDPE